MPRPIRANVGYVVLGLLAVPLLTPQASARGLGEALELEAARANARAGGPVSERDRELLERYGCLSGTNSPVCKPGYRRTVAPPPRKRRTWRE